MKIHERLMQKNGYVATQLAREWFTLRPFERVGTFDEYAKKLNAGRGTVQAAVKLLQENAVVLETRGHLGTFLAAIDYEKLWQFTGFGAVMGVMPLPYSKLYEGLATGLYQAAEQGKVPFSLAFMRGAATRLQALIDERYDFAVVSRLAAEAAVNQQNGVVVALSFGPSTYVHSHAIVFANPDKVVIEDGMRVGVDRTSTDQYLLTLCQCQSKQVSYVDLSYHQIIAKLQAGEIDAAIWNLDEVLERKLDLRYTPIIGNPVYGDSGTEAVLVVREADNGIKALLDSFISPAAVTHCQQQVVAGKVTPRY